MSVVRLAVLFALLLASAAFADRVVHAGQWGGLGAHIDVKGFHSQVEFDCSHGTISERFTTGNQGQFDLSGTFVRDGPGPINLPQIHPARYVGDVNGKTMNLTVIVTDTGETFGPYMLTRGQQPFIVECL